MRPVNYMNMLSNYIYTYTSYENAARIAYPATAVPTDGIHRIQLRVKGSINIYIRRLNYRNKGYIP